MSQASTSVRYHSLDALRAFAMLLGILLHVAWIMSPTYLLTPISDVSGNYYCHYFFHVVHMFRMQVFFLVAGFFARLVLERRGTGTFIRHRLSRIGLPLLLGWLVLFPWCFLYYVWGGLESGRILSSQGYWATYRHEVIEAATNQLPLIHLWFLYFLLLIYAMTLALRGLSVYVIDRKGRWRQRTDRLVARVIRSRWNVFWLAIPSAVLLWLGRGWYGIDANAWMLIPNPISVISYWLFFGAGWIMYGNASLLRECTKRWRLHLTLGLVVSLPLVAVIIRYVDSGFVSPAYPFVWMTDIRDYPRMRSQLLEAREDSQDLPTRVVWDSISPLYQGFIQDHTTVSGDQAAGLGFHLIERVVMRPGFYHAEDWREVELSPDVAALAELPTDERGFFQGMLLNRKLLETALPESIATDSMDQPFFLRLSVVYACGYAVAMWLLVFGTMGFFMHYFSAPSGLIRYISDSSYWLYLIHLPILFQIQVFVAQIEMNWVVKFLGYNLLAMAVMIPSYHYLVRSTFIGRILNGRAYPLVPLFRRRGQEPERAPVVSAPHWQRKDVKTNTDTETMRSDS